MKVIAEAESAPFARAADDAAALLRAKPAAVLGLGAWPSPADFPQALARACRAAGVSLSRSTVFAAEEYEGFGPEDPRSRAASLALALQGAGLAPARLVSAPGRAADDAAAAAYDGEILAAGGLDLLVLTVGRKGTVGFNGPLSPFCAPTRLVRLSDDVREESAAVFGPAEAVPRRGAALGIRTMMAARHVILLAAGPGAAEIAEKTAQSRPGPAWPATFFQLHTDAAFYFCRTAAEVSRPGAIGGRNG